MPDFSDKASDATRLNCLRWQARQKCCTSKLEALRGNKDDGSCQRKRRQDPQLCMHGLIYDQTGTVSLITQFEYGSGPHATADTHGLDSITHTTGAHVGKQGGAQFGTGASQGMA
jgi:hypothetical protein